MLLPRHCVLTALALVLCNSPFAAHSAEADKNSKPPAAAQWPSENTIKQVQVNPGMEGEWLLAFDYFFIGKPMAHFRIEVIPQPGVDAARFQGTKTQLFPPQFGLHHISTVLQYPGEGTSHQVEVSIVSDMPGGQVLASQRIDKVIQWPSQDAMDLRYAIDAIENGRKELLLEARALLERLIARNPNYDSAYIELARIAMKTNWGPEGLHHAETLLDSALKIKPDSANAKILLGYVYTHQQRFGEAEALFVDAARSSPPNLWLWTNWGEMFDMQGKTDQAIAKYREAVARPIATTTSFQARKNAYIFLLKLLEARKDVDGMEALYRERINEFGPNSCYTADYARFKLTVRADPQGAIDLARGALNLNCDDASSREILGLASYVIWAKGTSSASVEALNQARVYLPASPTTLYLLASHENTAVAAKKLVAGGERIDQLDDEKLTALAHALQNDKLEAAERLLSLGARPEVPVGYGQIPVALLPVMDGNFAAIRVLQRAGVDYSKLKYQGATAIDYAKQMGDNELLEILQPKELAL